MNMQSRFTLNMASVSSILLLSNGESAILDRQRGILTGNGRPSARCGRCCALKNKIETCNVSLETVSTISGKEICQSNHLFFFPTPPPPRKKKMSVCLRKSIPGRAQAVHLPVSLSFYHDQSLSHFTTTSLSLILPRPVPVSLSFYHDQSQSLILPRPVPVSLSFYHDQSGFLDEMEAFQSAETEI